MILLSLQHVQKAFGTNEVLKDVCMTLQTGERLGLVGVNGSGKSTLMKIIAGVEHEDGGTITMQRGLKLGYLAQQGIVDPERTVLEEMESVFEPVVRMEEELRSLKRLCDLPGDYEVYPGHMDSSTLERERNFNYYCREAKRRY